MQSANNLSTAFLGGRNIWAGGKAGEFRMLNLKTGAIFQPDVKFPIDAESFKVSPDGKFFFATDGKAIARFRIEGDNLVHEETSKNVLAARRAFLHLEMSTTGDRRLRANAIVPYVDEDAEIAVLDAKDLSRVTGGEVAALAGDQSRERSICGPNA